MEPIPFVPPIEARYGEAVEVSPLVRRIVAGNPSKYTYLGTGTYVVGRGTVAVIDPGPALDAHFDALLGALGAERVGAILVTHCHADHSPLARRLAEHTGAATYGFGPAARYAPEELAAADPNDAMRPNLGRAAAGRGDPVKPGSVIEPMAVPPAAVPPAAAPPAAAPRPAPTGCAPMVP